MPAAVPSPLAAMSARAGMLRAVGAAAAVTLAVAALAPSSSAAPPAAAPLRLEIRPGGAPQRTGLAHTLEAQVANAGGRGEDGVVVDFEITEGPGDDDVGTPGNTPETPDLSCVTAGGSPHRPATCTVSYVEQDNVEGSDAVLAWIDGDGLDATVEADLGEGENQHAPGPGGCTVDSRGPGSGAEPDTTDCASKRWMAREPATIDLSPETGGADAGATAVLDALVFDQFGDPLVGQGTALTVAVEVLAGSAHDPGDGTDFGSPDLGTCSTGETGGCSIQFTSSNGGADVLCAYVPGQHGGCAEPPEAPERTNGADVVQRSWDVPVPPPAPDQPAPEVPGEDGSAPPGQGGGDPDKKPSEPDRPAGGDDRTPEPGDGEPGTGPGGGEPGSGPGAGEPGSEPAAAAPLKPTARSPRRERRPSGDAAAGGRTRDVRSRPDRSPRRRGLPDSKPAAVPVAAAEGPRRVRRGGGGWEPRLAQLTEAAARTADRYSFPLGLTLLVLGFVAVQGRIDHRDPKLRLAPMDSKHDLLPFD